MPAGGVQDPVQRQIKGTVIVRQSRHRHRGNWHAVIAPQAGNDLLFLGLAERVRAIPDHFDNRVIRLGAGVGLRHLAHGNRCDFDQLFCQINGGPM